MARLPLALLSAAARKSPANDPIPLRPRGLVLGSHGADLVHDGLAHGSFGLGMTSDARGMELSLDVRLQLAQTLRRRSHGIVSAFSAYPMIPPIVWMPEPAASKSSYSDPRVAGFTGMFPDFDDTEMASSVASLRHHLESQYARLMHIAAMRSHLSAVHERRELEGLDDVTGAESVHLLEQDDELLDTVARWYKTYLRVDLSIEAEASAFSLWVGSGTSRANLARAGQGLQQVLPVVSYLAGLATTALDIDTLVLEEPELHLHPAVHGGIADLIVRAVATESRRNQVIVETHSENLVLRIRRHVAAGTLDPDSVNILWFEGDASGATAREILINADGSVTAWPSGVFSENLEEVRAIARESRR